jgi:Ca-activated chloride channel family protein
MWRLEYPWSLCLLLVVPLIIWMELRGKRKSALLFSSLGILEGQRQKAPFSPRRILVVLRSLALLFLILALARPQTGQSSSEVLTEGIDIILCLDTSGSMQALDFQINNERVNRLQVIKQVVARFIEGRKNDRIGMVVFAANAYTQCPLTQDYGVLESFLDRVQIGMAGDMTAVGSAIATSVKRLRDSKAKSKVVILLTDGRNNAGAIDPETAARLAKTFNIKVYTIGAGTKGPVPFVVDSPFGKQTIYQNVDLDEASLKQIAQITGGEYFRATDTRSLEDIYKKIDAMEKTKVKVKEYREYTEQFPFFLVTGLFFLGVEVLLGNTWLRKIP